MHEAKTRDWKPYAGDLVIGVHRLNGRAILAPMAGVTDPGMRRAASDFDATLTISEMVAASGLSSGDRESRLRAERPGRGLHAVQIAGCRGDDLAEAARLAESTGADLIDINMGCPAKRVTGGLAGSALMRDLPLAVELIKKTVAAVKVPVTVKMRLGWDEESLNAAELSRRAEAEGVAAIAVHGRTRCQFYKGRANWQAVSAVKAVVDIPVIANGDCGTLADARQMLAISGADAVMIGRAAMGQPWIVGDISHALTTGTQRPAVSQERRASVARDHYLYLLHTLGEEKGTRHARKHLAAYADWALGENHRGSWRQRLVTSDRPADVLDLIRRVFDLAGNPHHACAA